MNSEIVCSLIYLIGVLVILVLGYSEIKKDDKLGQYEKQSEFIQCLMLTTTWPIWAAMLVVLSPCIFIAWLFTVISKLLFKEEE